MQIKTRFVIKSSLAKMPQNCWGVYRRVAVMETETDAGEPKMISDHAKGCVAVHGVWDDCHVGSRSPRTAYQRAIAEARELVAKLENERDGDWQSAWQEVV